jgi:hypothetical protein
MVYDRWFSPDSPASSTTKTGRHDIAEILLKVALSTINHLINKKSIICTTLILLITIMNQAFTVELHYLVLN